MDAKGDDQRLDLLDGIGIHQSGLPERCAISPMKLPRLMGSIPNRAYMSPEPPAYLSLGFMSGIGT
jgi:hypothetical protein